MALTTHYSLLTTVCLPLTTYYLPRYRVPRATYPLPSVTYYPPLTTYSLTLPLPHCLHCLLLATYYARLTTRYLLLTTHQLPVTTYYSLLTTRLRRARLTHASRSTSTFEDGKANRQDGGKAGGEGGKQGSEEGGREGGKEGGSKSCGKSAGRCGRSLLAGFSTLQQIFNHPASFYRGLAEREGGAEGRKVHHPTAYVGQPPSCFSCGAGCGAG